MMEFLCHPSLTQLGLMLDVLGFAIIFFFGAFTFGIDVVITTSWGWYKDWMQTTLKVLGFLLVTIGFVLQIAGAAA